MKKLLPNDDLRDTIADAIKSLKTLRPTGNLTFATMTQEDYDTLMGVLIYFKDSLSPSRPLCKECRSYYGLTISMNCIKCKLGLPTMFSKLRENDFKHNYRDIRTHYKGKMFKDSIPIPPVPDNTLMRIDDSEVEVKEVDENYPSLDTYFELDSPAHKEKQEQIKKLKNEIMQNVQKKK